MIDLDAHDYTVTIATPISLGRGAEDQALATEARKRERHRAPWQEIIDNKLIEWGRDLSQLEDEDIVPPTDTAIHQASQLAIACRDRAHAPPDRVVPNGDGGIVFERWQGLVSETLEVFEDGSIEYAKYIDCRLQSRGPVHLTC